jgi:hypothetical protein
VPVGAQTEQLDVDLRVAYGGFVALRLALQVRRGSVRCEHVRVGQVDVLDEVAPDDRAERLG